MSEKEKDEGINIFAVLLLVVPTFLIAMALEVWNLQGQYDVYEKCISNHTISECKELKPCDGTGSYICDD